MPDSKLHEDEQDKQNRPKKADSRLMEEEGEKRSGSASDAHSGRKQSRLHENHRDQNDQQSMRDPAEFEQDLTANNLAGEDNSVSNPTRYAHTAAEFKEMHSVTLADLTNDELEYVQIVPEGTRLQQGAKYIDLHHLEQGEFTATSEMVASPTNAYVSKKDTDYVLWNRLNQVDTPARLDESAPQS
jgi:predicted  nucleic acid-binding Zn-ribbon protein